MLVYMGQTQTLTTMKTTTTQEQIAQLAEKAESRKQLIEDVDEVVNELMQADNRLWGINREIAGYGTWKVSLWLNEYHFGSDLSKAIMGRHIVTHDEDKQFGISDFEDIVRDACQEYAYENF